MTVRPGIRSCINLGNLVNGDTVITVWLCCGCTTFLLIASHTIEGRKRYRRDLRTAERTGILLKTNLQNSLLFSDTCLILMLNILSHELLCIKCKIQTARIITLPQGHEAILYLNKNVYALYQNCHNKQANFEIQFRIVPPYWLLPTYFK